MRKRKRKVQKNINFESDQIIYLTRTFGTDINISELFRQIVKLVITLLDNKIISGITDQDIKGLKSAILDEKMRSVTQRDKISEYKDIFEELVRIGRYINLEPSKLPSVLLNIANYYPLYDSKDFIKNPKYEQMLQKIALSSNMIDSVKLNKIDSSLEFTGSYPFSLLWYVKTVATLLATSKKYKWEIKKCYPEDLSNISNLRNLYLQFKPGESNNRSLRVVYDVFCNLETRIKDQDNYGIWFLLKNSNNMVIDQNLFNLLLKGEGGIPFQQYIEEIQQKGRSKLETTKLVLKFYRKINLIFDLSASNNRFKCSPIAAIISEVICKTLDYLEISYTLQNSYPFFTLFVET